MTNKTKTEKLEKIVGAGNAQITTWHAAILDDHDGRYYTNDLSSNRRLLTDEELAEMKSPGHGLIVVRLVDAPLPPENQIQEPEE